MLISQQKGNEGNVHGSYLFVFYINILIKAFAVCCWCSDTHYLCVRYYLHASLHTSHDEYSFVDTQLLRWKHPHINRISIAIRIAIHQIHWVLSKMTSQSNTSWSNTSSSISCNQQLTNRSSPPVLLPGARSAQTSLVPSPWAWNFSASRSAQRCKPTNNEEDPWRKIRISCWRIRFVTIVYVL